MKNDHIAITSFSSIFFPSSKLNHTQSREQTVHYKMNEKLDLTGVKIPTQTGVGIKLENWTQFST